MARFENELKYLQDIHSFLEAVAPSPVAGVSSIDRARLHTDFVNYLNFHYENDWSEIPDERIESEAIAFLIADRHIEYLEEVGKPLDPVVYATLDVDEFQEFNSVKRYHADINDYIQVVLGKDADLKKYYDRMADRRRRSQVAAATPLPPSLIRPETFLSGASHPGTDVGYGDKKAASEIPDDYDDIVPPFEGQATRASAAGQPPLPKVGDVNPASPDSKVSESLDDDSESDYSGPAVGGTEAALDIIVESTQAALAPRPDDLQIPKSPVAGAGFPLPVPPPGLLPSSPALVGEAVGRPTRLTVTPPSPPAPIPSTVPAGGYPPAIGAGGPPTGPHHPPAIGVNPPVGPTGGESPGSSAGGGNPPTAGVDGAESVMRTHLMQEFRVIPSDGNAIRFRAEPDQVKKGDIPNSEIVMAAHLVAAAMKRNPENIAEAKITVRNGSNTVLAYVKALADAQGIKVEFIGPAGNKQEDIRGLASTDGIQQKLHYAFSANDATTLKANFNEVYMKRGSSSIKDHFFNTFRGVGDQTKYNVASESEKCGLFDALHKPNSESLDRTLDGEKYREDTYKNFLYPTARSELRRGSDAGERVLERSAAGDDAETSADRSTSGGAAHDADPASRHVTFASRADVGVGARSLHARGEAEPSAASAAAHSTRAPASAGVDPATPAADSDRSPVDPTTGGGAGSTVRVRRS